MFKPILNNHKNDLIYVFAPFLVIFIINIVLYLFYPQAFQIDNIIGATVLFIALMIFDVPHVWGTMYKTYLDPEIMKKHKKTLILVPLSIFIVISFIVFSDLSLKLLFWLLALYAVYHFIKQQVWFVMLYSSKEKKSKKIYKQLDLYAVWLITLTPMLYWWANLDTRNYNWFSEYEFLKLPDNLFPLTWYLLILFFIVYIAIQIKRIFIEKEDVNYYKYLYLLWTFFVWFYGIVWTNNMLIFWLWNMLLHWWNFLGITYITTMNKKDTIKNKFVLFFLNHWYLVFILPLVLVGILEQISWSFMTFTDKNVYSVLLWNEIYEYMKSLNNIIFWIIVIILTMPQTTHYVLDGIIWRKSFENWLR